MVSPTPTIPATNAIVSTIPTATALAKEITQDIVYCARHCAWRGATSPFICGGILILKAGGGLAAQQAMNTIATQTTSTEQVVNSACPPVDGIYCDTLEQTAYHIHTHLTIHIDGKQIGIPQGIG
jgi:hypothetical protein